MDHRYAAGRRRVDAETPLSVVDVAGDEGEDGRIIGEFRSSGLRPYTLEKARQFGFDQAYLEACL